MKEGYKQSARERLAELHKKMTGGGHDAAAWQQLRAEEERLARELELEVAR